MNSIKKIFTAAVLVSVLLCSSACSDKMPNGDDNRITEPSNGTSAPLTEPSTVVSPTEPTTKKPDEGTSERQTEGNSQRPTQNEYTEPLTEPQEVTTPSADPVAVTGGTRCFYGKPDENADTFTKLTPLPLNDFANARIENTRELPVKTINHSFGVAKDGKAHSISENNQRFFDEGEYDALCLDKTASSKVIYLTFDCGYENGYTTKILDTLKEKSVKAAFFCTLPEMRENHDIIARMITEGHIVGNHSVTHPDFSSLSRQKMFDEVKGFDDYIREHFGYSSLYFRYPQGKYSESSLDLLNSMGYKCVFWSLAYDDWDLNKQRGAEYARNTVIQRLHPGAVILLHSVSPDNAAALGSIIDEARSMGYEFRSLDSIV